MAHRRLALGLAALGLALAVGAVPLEPNDPSIAASLKVWLKADVGVEKDVGVPALPGDTVRRWLDQSGNGKHVTQDTATYRPTLTAGVTLNGQAGLYFDGANDGFWFPQGGSAIAVRDHTYFVVVKPSTTSDNLHKHLISTDGIGTHWSRFRTYNTSIVDEWDDQGVSLNALTAASSQSVVGSYDGTTLFASRTLLTATPSTASATRTRIAPDAHTHNLYILGARNWQEFFGGYFSEVIVYNTALTQTQINGINEYLYKRFAAAVPEPAGLALTALAVAVLALRRPSVAAR
jgi:hypothetical protein